MSYFSEHVRFQDGDTARILTWRALSFPKTWAKWVKNWESFTFYTEVQKQEKLSFTNNSLVLRFDENLKTRSPSVQHSTESHQSRCPQSGGAQGSEQWTARCRAASPMETSQSGDTSLVLVLSSVVLELVQNTEHSVSISNKSIVEQVDISWAEGGARLGCVVI